MAHYQTVISKSPAELSRSVSQMRQRVQRIFAGRAEITHASGNLLILLVPVRPSQAAVNVDGRHYFPVYGSSRSSYPALRQAFAEGEPAFRRLYAVQVDRSRPPIEGCYCTLRIAP